MLALLGLCAAGPRSHEADNSQQHSELNGNTNGTLVR